MRHTRWRARRSLWMTRLVILSSRISRISILFTHCFSSTFSLPSYSLSLINFISLDQQMQTHINNTCLSKVFLFRNVQRPVRRQGSTRESWKHTIHFFISPETNPANPTVRLGCRLEHVSHSALDCEQLPRKKLDKPLQIWSQGGTHGCSEKNTLERTCQTWQGCKLGCTWSVMWGRWCKLWSYSCLPESSLAKLWHSAALNSSTSMTVCHVWHQYASWTDCVDCPRAHTHTHCARFSAQTEISEPSTLGVWKLLLVVARHAQSPACVWPKTG